MPTVSRLLLPISVLPVLLGGCGPHYQSLTPTSPILAVAPMHPHEAEYELLGTAQAQACLSRDEPKRLERVAGYHKTDDRFIGNGFLYEEAKYKALEAIKNADNMLFIRTK